ncbi:hypothetical protein [Hymenobacter nivis]|uniref:hypothetical protein n=1 Tax=Hymenobacter nivis TaxID=1850093 RepID=UPI001B86C62D|nr:hypothetical protein [Hymenobacter nivis]
MEKCYADCLREKFPGALAGKRLINLRIPDSYQFQDAALVALLRGKLAEYWPGPQA